MDYELVCNFRRCRRRVNTFAWVTSCSHIFCDEDGKREFGKAKICPACETNLPGKYDILGIDLHPSEQQKSMMLAGHKPEVIMEVCSRALAFWTYQAHQEKVYQEYIATKAREKNQQLESYYEGTVSQLESEVASLKSDLEATRKKYCEVTEKMTEKNRQYQKLQGLYDGLRRKCITPQSFEGDGDVASHFGQRVVPIRHDFRNVTTQESMLLQQRNNMLPLGAEQCPDLRRPSPRHSPPQRDFVLRPNSTPVPVGFSVLRDRERQTPQGPNHHPYKKH